MESPAFSSQLRESLALARDQTAHLQHEYVGTEHMLLAIARFESGEASTLFDHMHLDRAEIIRRVLDIIKEGKARATDASELPFTARSRKVLELALAETRGMGLPSTGTGALLIGLVGEGKGIAGQVLQELGLTVEALREALRALVANGLSEAAAPSSADVNTDATSDRPESPIPEMVVDSQFRPRSDRLALVIDIDGIPADLVARFMASLDALHRSMGGNGLVIEQDRIGTLSGAVSVKVVVV